MPVIDPSRRAAARGGNAVASVAILLASSAALAVVFLVSWHRLPAQQVLPVVSLAALALAAGIALIAWKYRAADARRPTFWDVAGALTFIGMGAAILSEPDQFVSLLHAANEAD